MEWSTPTSNVQNERVDFMPSPGLESNGWFHSFSYDPYAGNSYATMQTEPVITVPDSEMMINTYQCDPSNNDEMIKKKKRLTSEQLASLEICFQEDIKLDTERKLKLSKELGLQPRQTAVWFQNRRARWKVKHLEESYNSLRQEYDNVWREKQMLHDEVRKLKAIILRDQGLMMNNNQIAGGDHANNGIGEYNSPMMVGSSHVLWPGISQPPNPW